jgi:hypothetical protein
MTLKILLHHTNLLTTCFSHASWLPFRIFLNNLSNGCLRINAGVSNSKRLIGGPHFKAKMLHGPQFKRKKASAGPRFLEKLN